MGLPKQRKVHCFGSPTWQLAYQYVILYYVTGSCKGPIMVIVTTEGITVMEIAITFGDKNSYLGRESYLLLLSFLRKKRP